MMRFLAGEPIRARPIGRPRRLVKWARRHPTRAGLIGAAILLVVAAGALWSSNERGKADAAELTRLEDETATAVQQAVEKSREQRAAARKAPELDEIHEAFKEAVRLAELAQKQAERGPASAATRQLAAKALAEAEADREAWGKDRRLMARMLEVLVFMDGADTRALVQGQFADAEKRFAEAFHEWGLDPDQVPVVEAARQIKSRPAAVVVELLAALDHWAFVHRVMDHKGTQRLYDLANEADGPDTRRRKLRDLLARTRPSAAGRRLDRDQVLKPAAAMDPAREPTLTLVVLARALWEVDESGKMEEILRAAVLARPGDALLRAHLGSLYLLRGTMTAYGPTGKMVQALMQGTTVPANWWKDGAAARDRAAPLFQEAVGCFDVLRSTRPEAALPFAVALLQTPRREEGLTLLRKLLDERPNDALLRLVEAHALLLQGKLTEAEAAARKAAGSGGTSDLAQIGRLAEAQSALAAKDWKKAETLCRAIIDSTQKTALLSLAYERLGAALHGQQRTPEAITAFGESLRISQGIPSGHVYLAQKLEQVRDLNGADRLLGRGLKEDPDNAALLLYVAGFLRRQGREQEARTIQKKIAGARFPGDVVSLFKLGKGLMEIRENAASETAYRKLLELEPDHFEGNVNLAGALNHQGKYRDAEPYALKAAQLRSNSHWGHHVKGWALYGQGRLAEAEEPLRRAVELEPKFPDSPLMLGDTLRRLKQYAAAEPFLRKGIELSPRDPRGYGWLSEVLRELGNVKEADDLLRRANELSRPGNR